MLNETNMKVKDIMSRDVITITKGRLVTDACKIMRDKDVSSLVVICGENIEGIVTERDVLRKIIAKQREYHQMLVSDVMSGPVVTVDETATIYDAINLIYGRHIRRLVVVDANGKMAGIVTESDFLKALMKGKV